MKKQKTENPEEMAEQDESLSAELPEAVQEEEPKAAEAKEDARDIQIRELSDKYLRLAAEYDNFRKRTQKEKEALYADSILTVAASWLPVIDNLERGVAAAATVKSHEAQKIAEGMQLVIKQAAEAMANLGISEVEALGKTFDPNTMEAVLHADDENAGENEVVLVLTKGYIRGDRVIRHAQVKVAN